MFVSVGLVATSFIVPWFVSNADASPPVVTNYTDPSISTPNGIVAGPDGALWFTNSGNSIGRITTAGVVTNYTGTGISFPTGITVGPDGALWFTNRGNDSIGRITTAGLVTNYTDPSIDDPMGIAAGPDGALWFTNALTGGQDEGSIGRITTAGVVTNYTGTGIIVPTGIAAGPDGALWFTNNNSIGRITTAGVVTNYTDPSIIDPYTITAGPDGALWFTNGSDGSNGGSIGRITTAGVVTDYTGTGIDFAPFVPSIAAGPDGALWFTNGDGDSIGRITTAGTVTDYTDPSIDEPLGIAAGSDGALWFANSGGDNGSIGRITTPSSSPPPSTSVLIPSKGATLSGTAATLDASAGNATSVQFLLFGGIFSFNAPVVCTATLTYYGWVCSWNTTTVQNGSYTLVSSASGPGGTASSGVGIKVNNPPPTTSVLIPSKGATLSGTAATLDASAGNATSVQFLLFGGSYGYNGQAIGTATLTRYGWIYAWNTTTVPNGNYTLVSAPTSPVETTFGSGVGMTVKN